MTTQIPAEDAEYQVHDNFERCEPDYKLREGDRMLRIGESARPGMWFPIPKQDIGQRADYFRGSSFSVQKLNDSARPQMEAVEKARQEYIAALAALTGK